MSYRRPLILAASAVILAGCAAPPPVIEINSTGVPFKPASEDYDETYSRASNIGSVFQCPVVDTDAGNVMLPPPDVMKAQDGFTRPFAGGTISETDPLVLNAIRTATPAGVSDKVLGKYRHEYDQWWAMFPLGTAPDFMEAAHLAHREVTKRTDRALDLAGYTTFPIMDSVATDYGDGVLQIVSVRRIINEKAGCVFTDDDRTGCRVIIASTAENWTGGLVAPKWFGSVRSGWATLFMPVVAGGTRKDGSAFELPNTVREEIARTTGDGFFFYAPPRDGKPGFVGENRQLRYAVMTSARQERFRKKEVEGKSGGIAELWQKTKSDIRDVFRSGF